MPRIARIVIPKVAHHVTQRGNNRQDIFYVDDDRRVYLSLLKEYADQFGLAVIGYCLMTNHVHLVTIPQKEDSLAKAIGRIHFRYTQYINSLHGRNGHLWQNRFYSCALDDEHLWTVLSYIERNPVRAKIVHRAWDYKWSSAGAHTGSNDEDVLLDLDAWLKMWNASDWKKILSRNENGKAVEKLRLNTKRGRPLGGDRFISKLEHTMGRRLRPLPIGRPKVGKE